MDTKQPDALRLAAILGNEFDTYTDTWSAKEAAAELRRQHAENESLRAGYAAARLEIASLQAQLAAVGAGGVDPLRKRECLHQISEPAQALDAPGAPCEPSITLDFKMATELLKMFGEEPGLVTLRHGSERSHSGTGLYALYSHLPEEGAEFLGAEPDNKAMPDSATS